MLVGGIEGTQAEAFDGGEDVVGGPSPPEGLARLGKALVEEESLAPSAVTAFRLLLYTGARQSEIQTLKWEHVRGDRIHLPDSKSGGKTIPLNGLGLLHAPHDQAGTGGIAVAREQVAGLRYRTTRKRFGNPDFQIWGFAHITNLRTQAERHEGSS